MKVYAPFAMAAMICVAPASADDTQNAWQGFFTVKSSTTACAGIGGTAVGDTQVSIYRPKIASTDTASSLSIIHTRAAIVLINANDTANPQMRGSGTYKGQQINSRAKYNSYTSTFTNFATSPTSILASTQYVTVTGTINQFFNNTDCNITFKAVYGKRVD